MNKIFKGSEGSEGSEGEGEDEDDTNISNANSSNGEGYNVGYESGREANGVDLGEDHPEIATRTVRQIAEAALEGVENGGNIFSEDVEDLGGMGGTIDEGTEGITHTRIATNGADGRKMSRGRRLSDRVKAKLSPKGGIRKSIR